MSKNLLAAAFVRGALTKLSANARHVVRVLCAFADDDGRNAFPSVPTMAEITGLSEDTVSRGLREAIKDGVIAIEAQRPGVQTAYRISPEAIAAISPKERKKQTLRTVRRVGEEETPCTERPHPPHDAAPTLRTVRSDSVSNSVKDSKPPPVAPQGGALDLASQSSRTEQDAVRMRRGRPVRMSARGRLVQEALSHGRGDASIVDMNENGNVIPRSNPFDSRRT